MNETKGREETSKDFSGSRQKELNRKDFNYRESDSREKNWRR